MTGEDEGGKTQVEAIKEWQKEKNDDKGKRREKKGIGKDFLLPHRASHGAGAPEGQLPAPRGSESKYSASQHHSWPERNTYPDRLSMARASLIE